MLEVWASQRPVRALLAASSLVVGFAIAILLLRQNHFAIAVVIFCVGLAILVGTGKLATP